MMYRKSGFTQLKVSALPTVPGVRFIVFLQGCNMRCKYCHNPDTWNMNDGEEMTSDELLKRALRYKSYWKDSGG